MSNITLEMLQQYGLIGVLAWFMFRMEGVLKDNTKAIMDLTLIVNKLCQEKVNELEQS